MRSHQTRSMVGPDSGTVVQPDRTRQPQPSSGPVPERISPSTLASTSDPCSSSTCRSSLASGNRALSTSRGSRYAVVLRGKW